ncbi:MAG: hypothetical protein M3Q07_26860, partial [Pseudobdellovibrionaceae bacterium]|nr:hypothetical protein [Pseudobdellovibrionaceae bacterium]
NKPAMPLPIGLGRAVKPMSLIEVQRDPDTTLLVCLKPLDADEECAPEDYEIRSEILPRTEGPHRLCMKVRDKADNESLPYCQVLRVDGESPQIDLQWDLPALNVYAAVWRKPLGNFSASISRLSDNSSSAVPLQDRLQCRVEWSSPLGAVRKSEQVECLSGRCQGQVLSEFRDCDIQLEISVREDHLTVAHQSLVLIAKATDEAGNETESRASFVIADYYAPFVEGRAIRALVQDKKVPERIWVGTDSGVFRIEAGSVILYDQSAGLPANRVDALVAVDNEEGGVWAGTTAGLAYFDGKSWTPYATPNQDGSLAAGGFPGKRVYATLLDEEGRLIAGASNGIFRKVGETWEKIGNFSVMTLLMDEEGTLWAGTDDQGIARLESSGSWTFYNQTNGLFGHDFVWTLLLDHQGKIWAGTNAGLFTWESGVWKDFDPGRAILPSNSVYALFEDSQQRLWVGTESGYARRDATGWEVFDQRRAGLPNNNVRAFLEDGKKRVWIGTERGGARLGGNDFIVYNKKNSGLPGDLVEALAEDAEGRIWAGTDTAAARIDPMRWTVFREGNGGLPQAYMRAFFLDEHKTLWLGSDFGRIAQFDKQGWILSREDFEPEINRGIYAISRTNEGQIVAGGPGGFAVFDGQTWSPFRSNFVADSASASFLHDFLRTSRGELLAATDNNGVVIFEKAGWKKLPGSEQLSSLFVWSIAEDPSGTIWAATDGGLAKRKGNGWEMYTSTNSGLPINHVRAVLADRQGRIWAGTTGGGLARFDGTGWTVLNQDNSGLPGESVDSLLEDQLGRIWVGTKAGLARWDPE